MCKSCQCKKSNDIQGAQATHPVTQSGHSTGGPLGQQFKIAVESAVLASGASQPLEQRHSATWRVERHMQAAEAYHSGQDLTQQCLCNAGSLT